MAGEALFSNAFAFGAPALGSPLGSPLASPGSPHLSAAPTGTAMGTAMGAVYQQQAGPFIDNSGSVSSVARWDDPSAAASPLAVNVKLEGAASRQAGSELRNRDLHWGKQSKVLCACINFGRIQ